MKWVNSVIVLCFLAQNCHEVISLPGQNRLFPFFESTKVSMQLNLASKIVTDIFPRCDLIFLNFQTDSVQTDSNNFLQSFTENSKLLLNFHSLSNIKIIPFLQKSPKCKVVTIFVPDGEQEYSYFVAKFLNLLISETSSLKGNEDYFILITGQVKTAHAILQSPITRKLRYKVVITSADDKTASVLTSDLFQGGIRKLGGFTSGAIKNIFLDFTSDLNGNPLRVAATNRYFPSFQVDKIPNSDQYQDTRGVVSMIHQEVRRMLNTSYEIFVSNGFGIVSDGNSGYQMNNGTWIGCMGDVIAGRADLGMVVSRSYGRFPHVGWGSAIRYTSIIFTTRKPEKFLTWKAIYKSFTYDMWVGILTCIFIATLVMWNSDRFYDKNCRQFVQKFNNKFSYPSVSIGTIGNVFFNLFKSAVSQSMKNPKSNSSKCVFISWLVFVLIICTAYTSKLTSLLAFPEMENIPRTFRDMSTSHFRLGAPKSFKTGLGQQIFKNSPFKILRKLYTKMEKEEDSDDHGCLQNTLGKDSSCVSWEISMDFIIGTQYADSGGNHPFFLSSDELYVTAVSYIMQNNEPLLPRINGIVQRAFDTGLLSEMYSRDKINIRLKRMKDGALNEATRGCKTTSISNNDNNGNKPEPLTMYKLQGSALVFSCGICFATCVFVLEKIHIIIQVISISMLLFH